MENIIGVAVKAIIVHNGKILIVKRSANDEVGANSWEFVGGKLEFNEGLEQALIREIHEEAGINGSVDKLLYAATFKTSPSRQVVILSYLCSCDSVDVVLSDEHQEYLWASKAEVMDLVSKPILNDMLANSVFDLIDFK